MSDIEIKTLIYHVDWNPQWPDYHVNYDNITFILFSAVRLEKLSVGMKIYENPNRSWIEFLNITGYFLISGLIFLSFGIVFAIPLKKKIQLNGESISNKE